jgi:hypothetical protein
MTLENARTEIFRLLRHCPACGADAADNEDLLTFQRAEFVCGAVLTRLTGCMPVVNSPCPSPSMVAVKQLERDAARLASKEAA